MDLAAALATFFAHVPITDGERAKLEQQWARRTAVASREGVVNAPRAKSIICYLMKKLARARYDERMAAIHRQSTDNLHRIAMEMLENHNEVHRSRSKCVNEYNALLAYAKHVRTKDVADFVTRKRSRVDSEDDESTAEPPDHKKTRRAL